MKVALEAGLRRGTIHGRTFSEIVSMRITLRNQIHERNYTRKDFFGNRVYKKSKSDADFRCQSPIKYTRFQNENVRVYFACRFSISGRKSIYTIFKKSIACSVVTVTGKVMSSSSFDFYETPMPSVSFCLPTPFDCLYLFTYRSRPVQTNKKIDDFFFACGCRAGILLDFQMIIERGPEMKGSAMM